MSHHQPTHYAMQSPLDIPELAEDILNRLSDTRDVLHVRATSKFLKAMVDTTRSIQRRLWKRLTPVKRGEDPHIQQSTEVQSALYVQSKWTIFEAFHLIDWEFYDKIEAGGDEASASIARNQQFRQMRARIVTAMRNKLLGFPENSFPLDLQCRNCMQPHAPFKSSGLHHALRDVQNHEMCGRGYASELLFHFSLGRNLIATPVIQPELDEPSWWGFYRSGLYRIVSLNRALNKAYEVAKQHDLLHDYCTAPMCTRLILIQSSAYETRNWASRAERTILRDDYGIKVGQVLSALLKMCRRTYWNHCARAPVNLHGKTLPLYEETMVEFPMHPSDWPI
jgi:hypothetical protein